MAKSKKKKYNKKKKNPNRAPQSGAVKKPSGGGAAKSGSAVSKPSPARQREMWIAIAVALGVFVLLLLVARLSNRNDETAEPDAESVISGESVASGDEESVTSGDAEASENAASAQSGDAATSAASGDSADATASTDSGDSATATTSTGSGDSATATTSTDSGASDATAATSDAQSVTSGDTATRDANAATTNAAAQSADADAVNATEYADIVVKDYGTITVALDGATAPITVQNFVSLAKSGFYDGLTFHRIMDGFMIQGGDPLGNGTGGAENNIVGEFKSNGIVNNISHVRGTISMARASGDENSASSQFFIVQKDSVFLDGDYAAFGRVTSGMEVVDKICADAKPTDDNGTIKPEEQPVITSVTIRDN